MQVNLLTSILLFSLLLFRMQQSQHLWPTLIRWWVDSLLIVKILTVMLCTIPEITFNTQWVSLGMFHKWFFVIFFFFLVVVVFPLFLFFPFCRKLNMYFYHFVMLSMIMVPQSLIALHKYMCHCLLQCLDNWWNFKNDCCFKLMGFDTGPVVKVSLGSLSYCLLVNIYEVWGPRGRRSWRRRWSTPSLSTWGWWGSRHHSPYRHTTSRDHCFKPPCRDSHSEWQSVKL